MIRQIIQSSTVYLLFIVLTLMISCGDSSFDSSTGLGKDIINDYDSNSINISENIKTIIKDLPVLRSFSKTDSFSTLTEPGLHKSGDSLAAGSWKDLSSVIYTQFDGESFLELIHADNTDSNTQHTLCSLTIIFQSFDDLEKIEINPEFTISEPKSVFKTVTENIRKTKINPFSLSVKSDSLSAMVPLSYTAILKDIISTNDTNYIPTDTSFHWTDNNLDSVTIKKDTLFNAGDFGLLLNINSEELVMLGSSRSDKKSPALRLVIKTDSTITDGSVISYMDTVILNAEYSDYSISSERENDFLLNTPFSSGSNSIFSVFAFDLTPFWNSMRAEDKKYQNIQYFKLSLGIDSIVSLGAEKDTTISFMYFFDSSFSDTSVLTANKNSAAINLTSKNHEFIIKNMNSLMKDSSEDMLADILLPDTGYLYLIYPNKPVFCNIYWGKPENDNIEIEAVVSNPETK